MSKKFSAVVWGRPYVKKNNQRAFGNGRFKRIVYSDNYKSWEQSAILQLRKQLAHLTTFDVPVNLACRFYFENRRSEPDLSAMYEGIQDILQKMGTLKNDKLVVSHDGSGKFFGYEARLEIEITEKPEEITEGE